MHNVENVHAAKSYESLEISRTSHQNSRLHPGARVNVVILTARGAAEAEKMVGYDSGGSRGAMGRAPPEG